MKKRNLLMNEVMLFTLYTLYYNLPLIGIGTSNAHNSPGLSAITTVKKNMYSEKIKKEQEEKRIKDKHLKRLSLDAKDNAAHSEIEEKDDMVNELPKAINGIKIDLSTAQYHTLGSYSRLKHIFDAQVKEFNDMDSKLGELNKNIEKFEDKYKIAEIYYNDFTKTNKFKQMSEKQQSDYFAAEHKKKLAQLPQDIQDKYFAMINDSEELKEVLQKKYNDVVENAQIYKQKTGIAKMKEVDKIAKEHDTLGDFYNNLVKRNQALKEQYREIATNKNELIKDKSVKSIHIE